MNHSLGLVIESLVAVLLLLTIGYCALLNKRLKLLRNDEQSMRGTIAELVTATEIAERAIGGLKVTVRECDENLGVQLLNGAELSAKLRKQVAAGEEILHRLSQIALAARPHEAPPAPQAAPRADAKAVLAAAQAFSERARGHGRAA
ncbi:MAG: chemotaxis protein [Rhizobiales bacterium]|nr:chemotaxis protein [Hyphomicrobiales bacterium]